MQNSLGPLTDDVIPPLYGSLLCRFTLACEKGWSCPGLEGEAALAERSKRTGIVLYTEARALGRGRKLRRKNKVKKKKKKIGRKCQVGLTPDFSNQLHSTQLYSVQAGISIRSPPEPHL